MRAQLLARSLIAVATMACASAHTPARTREAPVAADTAAAIYERYGLIVLPLGGVGQFFFRAGPTADSTNVLFIASYPGGLSEAFDLELVRGGTPVHSFRVQAQSAVSQEMITVAPGAYHLTLGLFDSPVVVPREGSNSLATPVLMRHTDALPRATAIIGRDTAIDVYLEAYGTSRVPVTLSAPGWRDTVALDHHGKVSSGTVQIPISRLGPGETTLVFARGRDSVTAPVFLTFGSLNAVSFEQVLGTLRYFAPPAPLDSLRNTPRDKRARAWATFMARYGERLPGYFARVREANKRYGEMNAPGWETDRGRAYVQLGDPDQVFVEPDIEIWVYTRYFGRLKFDHRRLVPESRQMLATLVAQARSAR